MLKTDPSKLVPGDKFTSVLFVCFGSVTAFVPWGQLPTTTQATRHPRASSLKIPVHCSPVLLSCLLHQVSTCIPGSSCRVYILISIWSVPYLSSRHVHIPTDLCEPFNNHQTPHINCVTLLYSNKTKIQQLCNSKASRSPHVSSMPTCSSTPHLQKVAPFPFTA